MIHYIENIDIFSSTAQALVNPVNCAGVMGKGIAKEFKLRYPEYLRPYKSACEAGILRPGKLMLCQLEVQLDNFEWKTPGVIFFPTKDHWRSKSRLEWIDAGLIYLKDHYSEWKIKSVAIPQLGCGLGGLQWQDVSKLIEKYFANDELDIEVYMSAIDKYEKFL